MKFFMAPPPRCEYGFIEPSVRTFLFLSLKFSDLRRQILPSASPYVSVHLGLTQNLPGISSKFKAQKEAELWKGRANTLTI